MRTVRHAAPFVITALLVAACSSGTIGGPVRPQTTPEPVAADDPTAAPEEPVPTVKVKLPKSYAKLGDRAWKKVVKSPDNYIGRGYQLWACITQFDAATGEDAFRGDTSFHKLAYWYEGENVFFTGEPRALVDIVQGDVVQMNVVGTGSYSYDTQAGGNTTAPSFLVTKITRKGSC